MFEKEAEEATLDLYGSADDVYGKEDYKQGFKDGGEFVYNKANEWHYVKNGDLPKHEVNVLVLFNKQCIDIAHYNYDYKEWHFTDSIVRDVIAWKEIVLPKGCEEKWSGGIC